MRKVLLAGIVVLGVLALLIVYVGSDPWGATTVPNVPPTTAPKGAADRAPFLQALDNLAGARGLRYQETSTRTGEQRDVWVSRSGMLTGTLGDQARGVLRIGGQTFTRRQPPPDEGDPGGASDAGGTPSGDPTSDTASPDGIPTNGVSSDRSQPTEWTVDDPGEAAAVRQADRFRSPADLAAQLRSALSATHALPDPKGAGRKPESVDGVPALRIDTTAGSLLVSKGKPYRVLGLKPYAPAAHSAPPRKRGASSPAAPSKVTVGPLKGDDSVGMTLTPLSDDQVGTVYDTLAREAGRLGAALDGGVAVSRDDAGDLDCGPDGCAVTERFTARLEPAARARGADRPVIAVLRATVVIGGRDAGSCTSDRVGFPLDAGSVSGSLSCLAADAGSASAGVDAGTGNSPSENGSWRSGHRRTPRFSARIHAVVEAVALPEDEVGRLVAEVRRERDGADGGAP
ncbi:hypothetical protein [Streptomyces sp. WZ-12]|uniref:hypothetical protein n=1 Tax=Streptomyces sp. WZ-12 TaxID=3030210 RepID=UPI0023817098|nr:hypothetical protein [Streptomyces sp. WZ-12]